MNDHRLYAIIALIVMALACNSGMENRTWTNITSITITPLTGEKDFSLEVKYNYTWYRDQPNAEIYCMYTFPGGGTIPIGTIVPAGLDRDREAFSKTDILTFSIKPKDGKIIAGNYLAGCATEHENSLITTPFTVIEGAAPTPTPEISSGAVPTPTSTRPVQAAFKKGQIVFDYARTESSRPGAGGDLSRVTNLCIPEIMIGADGKLNGQCEKLHITALLTDESITTQVTGGTDESGNITFSYDVSEIGTPNGAWRISFEGTGKFSSAAQAEGTATFSYSCNSGADNLIWCWKSTSESFSGTIPWSFIPSP